MAVRGYWLTRLGELMWGDKLTGTTDELTKQEYDALFDFAPEHRAQALPLLRRQAEYDEVTKANNEAVINEVMAHDTANKAAEAAQQIFNEHQAALKENPDAPIPAIEEAIKVAQEARAAADAASAVTAPLQVKMAELRELMQSMPPRRVMIA